MHRLCQSWLEFLFVVSGYYPPNILCLYPSAKWGCWGKQQHLLNVARSLRFQAYLPISFSGDCVLTTAHLINILPAQDLDFKSPHKILFQTKFKYDQIRVFGCLCYISNMSPPVDKFARKALQCVFLGYPFHKKGYRVMERPSMKCFITRDIWFVETVFPFQQLSTSQTDHSPTNTPIFPNSSLFVPDNVCQPLLHTTTTPYIGFNHTFFSVTSKSVALHA